MSRAARTWNEDAILDRVEVYAGTVTHVCGEQQLLPRVSIPAGSKQTDGID